ncbi:RNA polymerase sigma factor [Undibacterium sp. SXout20W]|uniref:RNA polymerase sigma factor n=1 Tax=Undibacterium sp. SXout20W TaxID=3413051 RepID=UPI003BF3D7E4
MQEVHVVLWQSFANFKDECSLRTWVYRVAHNVGVTYVQRRLRAVNWIAKKLPSSLMSRLISESPNAGWIWSD